jgi:hypothetical protein
MKGTELALPWGSAGEDIRGPTPVDVAAAEHNTSFASLELSLLLGKSGKR